MKSDTHNMKPLSQITLRVLFKLFAVLALILAIGAMTEQVYWTIISLGAALGMFLAEHFASTRTREFLFLLCLPAAFGCVAMTLPLLQYSAGHTAAEIGLWPLLGLLVSIVPAAFTVLVLSIVSHLVFKLTGLRLLKFEWNPALERVVED